jgi:hypothetical protein
MLTTLDLSSVTGRLIEVVETAIVNSPLWTVNGGTVPQFTIQVSSAMPEAVRNLGDCQLTFYLFHLNAEPFTRNLPPNGGPAQPNSRQPLGLTLYYLVTAFAKNQSDLEQQAMSIVLNALHERTTYVDPANGFTFTVSLEQEKPDEANRRWQAFSTSFRLSAVYRVAVIFLTPQSDPPRLAAPPHRLGLAVAPQPLLPAHGGSLTAAASRIELHPFPANPGDVITYDVSPAVASPGSSIAIFGTGLDTPTAARLYLIDGAGIEREVTAWRTPVGGAAATRILLTLPAGIAAPPGGSPDAGAYLVRAGSSLAAGDAADHRTNSVPVLVTARVDPVPAPWVAVGGTFSFTGGGFIGGATDLLLETVALTADPPGSVPADGEFASDAAGTAISFRPPAGFPSGRFEVRVRVRGIEGPPVGRISLP